MNYIASLDIFSLEIPFRHRFSHASATREKTCSIWVEAGCKEGLKGFGEGCPREYVTGETLASGREFFSRIKHKVISEIFDLQSLKGFVAGHRDCINENPAAWCAVELALIDLLSKREAVSAEQWLGLPPTEGVFTYSAVLGDSDIETFSAFVHRYSQMGFTDYKIKISGEATVDRKKIEAVRKAIVGCCRLRVDANNLWSEPDAVLAWLDVLDQAIFAIEEPLRVEARDLLPIISQATETAIILDESFLRIEQFETLEGGVSWILNVRASKYGGILRSLDIVYAARRLGIPLIVGSQVGESSLLTRVGLTLAMAAGDSLIAQEGAFGTLLLAEDVVGQPLMFGHGGQLRFVSNEPGWGLHCSVNNRLTY